MSGPDRVFVVQYVLVPERRQPGIALWTETVSAQRVTAAHLDEMLWDKLSHPSHSGRRGNPRPTGIQLIDTLTGEPVLTVLAAGRSEAAAPILTARQ